ncbi:MAG: nucleotide exchange factor GrpE [Candidatus Yonathbacteria bacterium RIFOXYC1_FULL_52_10]|uniref:Protein GrpE n=1 Tax=Candidatus Yonathbacteria bacterium RIFOXYD1_FULL_52_36 TaxID=1802730 RepID=A0A1G2SJ04_9BACT|nr:MAG: nucleotide exchange factor GrpE [Candidatus Yonathbacteria bacterium RIFOXYC1_FULL_52_10]OHA85077.1 MAG: nucleotide exchange factor GrpE [Candidatus Yonathbacteria bacterium RIFOXYD1_FULL_52_36]
MSHDDTVFDEAPNDAEGDLSEELVFEEDAEGVLPDASEKLKKLKEKLALCQKEREEYLNGWQRARADFANAKRDEDARRVETVKHAKESVFIDILPALDSFDMAFGNKTAWESVSAEWRKGVEYIYAQLLASLEKNGITPIDPEGLPFDHHEHMSVESVPATSPEEHDKVVGVVQKGYRLYGKVIRPARVRVAHHGEAKS